MNEGPVLRIERLVDAAPEAVFDVWTTREAMEEWYRDGDDYSVRVTELDLRVGGRYRVEFGPTGRPPFVEHGEYLEIDRPHRLVMTESLDGVDVSWSGTRVTVSLSDENGKTRMVLLHEGWPSVEHRDGAAEGWPGFLDRIERLAAAVSAPREVWPRSRP